MRLIVPLAAAALLLAGCQDTAGPVAESGPSPATAGLQATQTSRTGVPVIVLGPGEAHDVNARGQVVGWSYNAAGDRIAVLWQDGEMIDLGAPPDLWALAINDRGEIVIGVWHPYSGPSDVYYWYRGELTMIVPDATVRDINARGQVLGFLRRDAATDLAFVWEDGELTFLDPLPGNTASRAEAMNQKGEVVGFSAWGDSGVYAQFWESDGDTYLLPAPEGYAGRAMAINNRGLAAGRVELSGRVDQQAVLWQDGQLLELDDAGGFGSGVHDMNSGGMMAGYYTPPDGEERPALWLGNDHHLVDLGLPQGDEYAGPARAFAVNERGVVVGSGGGATVWAYLWKP